MPEIGALSFATVVIPDGAGHFLQLPSLTQGQRNDLTPVNGMHIYNTFANQVQVYDNGSWRAQGQIAVATHAAIAAAHHAPYTQAQVDTRIALQSASMLHHPMTLSGSPTWVQLASGLWVLDFDYFTPDFLECPAALTGDLDFTGGDFSLAIWANPETVAAARILMLRGDLFVGDGWSFHLRADNGFGIDTYTGASARLTYSAAAEISAGSWALLGATRAGAACKVYKNGADVTDTAGSHLDPSTSNRKLLIGIEDDESANPFNGMLWYPRCWNRKLEAAEMASMFGVERLLFGV